MSDTPTLKGYEASMVEANLGPRTIEEYVGIVRRGLEASDPLTYIKSIANLRSRAMPLAAFQRWAAYTKNAKLAATLKAHKDSLKHRIPPARERYPYSQQEMERMSAGVDSAGRSLAERFALKMLLGTGARSSDICSGITREVLHEAMSHGWKVEIRTKGQRLRTVDFEPFVDDVKALLAAPAWKSLYELLAPARDGRPCTNKRGYRILDLRFKVLCQSSNVSKPWITHRCRHTLASMVYGKTHDLMATRNWFGWASTATAERYSHGAKFDEVNDSVRDILPHFEDKPKKPPRGKQRA